MPSQTVNLVQHVSGSKGIRIEDAQAEINTAFAGLGEVANSASADDLNDGTGKKVMTADERTKLAEIPSDADKSAKAVAEAPPHGLVDFAVTDGVAFSVSDELKLAELGDIVSYTFSSLPGLPQIGTLAAGDVFLVGDASDDNKGKQVGAQNVAKGLFARIAGFSLKSTPDGLDVVGFLSLTDGVGDPEETSSRLTFNQLMKWVFGQAHTLNSKTTPDDADVFAAGNAGNGFAGIHFTWANIVAALQNLFVSTDFADDYDVIDPGDANVISFAAPDQDGHLRELGGFNADGVLGAAGFGDADGHMVPYATADDAVILLTDQDDRVRGAVYPNVPEREQVTCDDYETADEWADVVVVDGNNRVLWTSEDAVTGAGAIADGDIRQFAPSIDLTGATDQSAVLQAAHAAARAAGYRVMYIEGPILAPTAYAMDQVQFLTRTGKGRLIGTFSKRVVPVTARPIDRRSGIVPERHLAQFRTALAASSTAAPAIIVFATDSWGWETQHVAHSSNFEQILRAELQRQFGPAAENILLVNRAIGGCKWKDLAANPTSSNQLERATWYPDDGSDWLDHVVTLDLTDHGLSAAETPDLVLISLGINQLQFDTILEGAQKMKEALDLLETKRAAAGAEFDVVLCANSIPNQSGTDEGGVRSRQVFSGLTRSYTARHGLGLIDWGQAVDAGLLGFDPTRPWMSYLTQDEASGLPYTFSEETTDFTIKITAAGAENTFWSTGDGLLTVKLSPLDGAELILEQDGGGNIAYTVNVCTGWTDHARTVTGRAGSDLGVDPELDISVVAGRLVVRFNDEFKPFIDIPIIRGGGAFVPTIGFGGGGTLGSCTITTGVARYQDAMPTLIADEMWGGDDSEFYGSGGAHLAEPGRDLVWQQTLQHTRFS